LLRNKHEAEKQLKDMSSSEDGGSPLSALEKSLCYVLVDKALLNCLLILDKALMDGKLTDSELSLQFSTVPSGQKLVSEFSQALNEKRQFIELSDELKRREILVDKMRTQIRELSSEKMRLENENKSFEEKSRLWQLKSEDEEMRNSVIDSDRKRLKEKVLFLEESMSGLQSSTEHLRQQLQTLEHNEDASRQENEVLKEKLQNYSDEMKRDVQNATHLSSTTSSGNSKNMAAKIDSLLKENEELRNKITALETEDYELREKSISVTYAHKQAIQQKIEEIRLVEEQNRTLGEDLDTHLTEILLLKAQVVELQESISQGNLKNLQNQVGSTHDNTDGVWFQKLSHRAETSEHRVEEYAILLEELAKRKGILVSKLEMVGAVTVIKNDCDVPDGYTEAIDGVLRTQTTLIEKGNVPVMCRLLSDLVPSVPSRGQWGHLPPAPAQKLVYRPKKNNV
jgi:chromosome segregation ATPase